MKNSVLTPREVEIIQLIMQGYNNRKVSEELCISEHTTKAHLSSIYEKLGVVNRVQAVVKYLQVNKVINISNSFTA